MGQSQKNQDAYKNMKIGPKFKIARRLGAPVFEKTQTQKYALNLEKKSKKSMKPKSEFGIQMNEKQKARFVYGLSESQFSGYVKTALAKKSLNPVELIYNLLELRLDNIVYRLGFSPTRAGARQAVSHGHISVNGKRVTIPSMHLRTGDKISITGRSLNKGLFKDLDERNTTTSLPSWLKLDTSKRGAEVIGVPTYNKTENMFDLNTVVEFYSR